MFEEPLEAIQEKIRLKMADAGLQEPVIRAFGESVSQVYRGRTGLIAEGEIEPVDDIPSLESFGKGEYQGGAPLESLAVIKLNGGLGTGMGLDKAKSLLPVKGTDCFLDFIARQVLHLRQVSRTDRPRFLLMNSFSTREDSLDYLSRYPELAKGGDIDFVQNKVPKLDAATLAPVSFPANPDLEWCPPGHGDLYPSLMASGLIDQLLDQGVRYLFVSNSDNLGATVDLDLLGYFASSGLSFLMEVASRTQADSKGGHLARRKSDQRLILRESAQCPDQDANAFQDINTHRFFNTNSLWIQLEHLKARLEESGGFLPLPLIRNRKTVDPSDPDSTPVFQIESAMGAAIECFSESGAILVPRSRFAPVKTTNDLMALRSDAYVVTEDSRLELHPDRGGIPPVVRLDPRFYKMMGDFDRLVSSTVPSMVRCNSLTVEGAVRFPEAGTLAGDVTLRGSTDGSRPALMSPDHFENGGFTLQPVTGP
jgi:UDP-N-acetylglucosamine pyrophosphorylase